MLQILCRISFNKIKVRCHLHRKISSLSMEIEEKQIKVDKWNVNYINVGSGSHHVFCLPGALGTIWTDFRPQIQGFDRKLFTLIVWDSPGYGKSRPPDKEFTHDYYQRDADYAYEFMRVLEIPKYSLLGWSDGAMAALILAGRYPHAVEKVVVAGAGSQILPEDRRSIAILKDVNAWSEQPRKTMTEVYGDKFLQYWAERIECLETMDPDICAYLLKDIKCPTFVLHGAKDAVTCLEGSIYIAKNITGARHYVYPEGKHNIHIKYSDDFNRRVQDFLLQ